MSRPVLWIAAQELTLNLRNRWVVSFAALYTLLTLMVSIFGMVTSGKVITLEIGMRFLTDYLQGDQYFKISRPGHNLDRARAQFKLVTSIENQETAMRSFVERWHSNGVGLKI